MQVWGRRMLADLTIHGRTMLADLTCSSISSGGGGGTSNVK